jgi:hypothetical protein
MEDYERRQAEIREKERLKEEERLRVIRERDELF